MKVTVLFLKHIKIFKSVLKEAENQYYRAIFDTKCSQNEFQNYMSKQIPNSMVCETVTRSEIINIVSALRDNKSPGPDNIGPKILKPILSCVTDPLLYICNLSFTTGCVPNSLKVAKVVPIFKKGDTINPSKYRPISLLSVFL